MSIVYFDAREVVIERYIICIHSTAALRRFRLVLVAGGSRLNKVALTQPKLGTLEDVLLDFGVQGLEQLQSYLNIWEFVSFWLGELCVDLVFGD